MASSEEPQTKTPNKRKQQLSLQSVADKGSIIQSVSSTSMPTVAIASLEISRSQFRKNFIKEMR
eukprot:scaffold26473_cov142-Cylindrotheca_fusiformis.AAC.1